MSIPRATMRLQFHRGFGFDDAIEIVPYLARLGVSHLYASPIMTARAGSMHGYDVVDPTTVNPELGGEAAFRRLVATLRQAGLGIIVDIVPNHMAVGGSDNAWWLDVLQHGRQSRYAHYFDIDWKPGDPALHDKILVPVLGRPYGEALREGEIGLAIHAELQRYEARYFQHVFPIDPEHMSEIAQHPLEDFDATTVSGRIRLQALLERQHFRLAWWRCANDAINWRRFFDINELAALRVEAEDVFAATHATLFRLYADGLIDGVRIDHIDGLADPKAYCQRLRALFDMLRPGTDRPYLIVEKILAAQESLPHDWGCDGTSGYDFMDQVSRVLHDPQGQERLARNWHSISGRPEDFAVEEETSRREILARSFSAQLDATVGALHKLAEQDLMTRDIAPPAIRRALVEILAHMRVYRTYAGIRGGSPADQEQLARAVAAAERSCLRQDCDVLRQLAIWLGGETKAAGDPAYHRDAIRRFQQLSAPLAAKAVEDTAFYRYGPLLSRVDVGFDPRCFGDGSAGFHRDSAARAADFPHALLATATHDHKRGEDVRARLAVLSENPGEWSTMLADWLHASETFVEDIDGRPAPMPGDIAILFQMLVGAWPLDLSAQDVEGLSAFAERMAEWQLKALREAKLETDWTVPNAAYEAAARRFMMRLFTGEWPKTIAAFVTRIAPAGALNGLAQTLLKLTAPGIPDIYQGTEFWDLSLVDPDNRRPVDFSTREKSLTADESAIVLAASWRDGRLKQALIRDVLAARHAHADLFTHGSYIPLEAEGAVADHVLAFARQHGEQTAIVVAGRLMARWLEGGINVAPAYWGEAALRLPAEIDVPRLRNLLAKQDINAEAGRLPLARIFGDGLPLALLLSVHE